METRKDKRISRNYIIIFTFFILILEAYLNPNRISIDLFCLFSLVIVILIVHFKLVRKKITCEVQEIKEPAHKGEKLTVTITVRNSSFLPTPYIYLFLKDGYRLKLTGSHEINLILGPKAFRTIEVEYIGTLSGKEKIGIEEMLAIDYFYLKQKSLKDNIYTSGKVIPNIEELKNLDKLELFSRGNNRTDASSYSRKNLRYSEEQDNELRAYREGDSKRNIHWKLLAQKNQWLVRDRQECLEENDILIVIMDPVSETFEEEEQQAIYEDRILTAITTILYELVNKHKQVGFSYYFKKKWYYTVLNNIADLKLLMYRLSEYTFKHKEISAARIPFYKLEREQKLDKAAIILVTGKLDDSLKRQMNKSSRIYKQIRLIYLGEEQKGTNGWHLNEENQLQ